jgi:hypothetical protein
MKPQQFKEATIELSKPKGMTDEECSSLWIHRTPKGECVSLWTAPLWARIKFLFHGKLWLGVLSGKTQPPVWLDMTKTVFIKNDKNGN